MQTLISAGILLIVWLQCTAR